MIFEKLKQHPVRTAALAATIGLAALLTSCGDQSGNTPTPKKTTAQDAPGIKVEYYPNGTRIIRYENDGDWYADVLGSCDGTDLVEQTEFLKYGYGAAENSVERSVNHPACADGKLTPADFKIAG